MIPHKNVAVSGHQYGDVKSLKEAFIQINRLCFES